MNRPAHRPALTTLRISRGGPRGDLHVFLAHEVVDRLASEDRIASAMLRYAVPTNRYAGIRLLVSRIGDISMPAFHVAIEAPGPDPRGLRLRIRPDKPGQARFVVSARSLGFDYSKVHALAHPEHYWPDQLPGLNYGLLVMVPDDWRVLPLERRHTPQSFFAQFARKR